MFDFSSQNNSKELEIEVEKECEDCPALKSFIRCRSWESEIGDGVLEHSQAHEPCMLPLVKYNKGLFEICPTAASILASLAKPICLCTVYGSPNTGKSTLISRSILAFDTEGQKISAIKYKDDSPSDRSSDCTALWMWGRPLTVRRDSGEVVTIVICENGKGDGEWIENECILFALSILFSSHLLFNGTSLLDEQRIAGLKVVKQLTRYIRSKSDNQGDEDGVAFREFFPSITWVVRNAVNDKEISADIPLDHFLSISSRSYLQKALCVSGYSDEAEQKNIVRKMIASFFPKCNCFLFPCPSQSPETLANLARIPDAELDPGFLAQLAALRRHVLLAAPAKSLYGSVLSGEMIVDLLGLYIDGFNRRTAPSVPSALHALGERRARRSFLAALAAYHASLGSVLAALPESDQALSARLRAAAASARATFDSGALPGPAREAHRAVLEDHFAAAHHRVAMQNLQRSRRAALLVAEALYSVVEAAVEAGEVHTLTQYEDARAGLRREFAVRTAGLSQYACGTVLAEFLGLKLLLFTQRALSRSATASSRNDAASGGGGTSLCSSVRSPASPPSSPPLAASPAFSCSEAPSIPAMVPSRPAPVMAERASADAALADRVEAALRALRSPAADCDDGHGNDDVCVMMGGSPPPPGSNPPSAYADCEWGQPAEEALMQQGDASSNVWGRLWEPAPAPTTRPSSACSRGTGAGLGPVYSDAGHTLHAGWSGSGAGGRGRVWTRPAAGGEPHRRTGEGAGAARGVGLQRRGRHHRRAHRL